MTPTTRLLSHLSAALLLAAGLLASPGLVLAAGLAVSLSGSQEVPPNSSAGKANGQIAVAADGTVSGAITVSGMTPTVAHIHDGAAGKNGPVIVKLDKTDSGFAVPPGTKFNEAQLASFNAGNTYINVHSEAFPPGEIRGQLTPASMPKPPGY